MLAKSIFSSSKFKITNYLNKVNFTNKSINLKFKLLNTEYNVNGDVNLTSKKIQRSPESERIASLILVNDITKPEHIKIDPNIINLNYNCITDQIFKKPKFLQLMLRYPITTFALSYGAMVDYNIDTAMRNSNPIAISIIIATMFLVNNIPSSYPSVFSISNLPFSNCGIGILARHRIKYIHEKLFENYKGNVEYVLESRISNKYLIDVIMNFVNNINKIDKVVDTTAALAIDNIIKSNKTFYENNLQTILIKLFDCYSHYQSIKSHNIELYKNNIFAVFNSLQSNIPHLFNDEFVVQVVNGVEYTFKRYCNFHNLDYQCPPTTLKV